MKRLVFALTLLGLVGAAGAQQTWIAVSDNIAVRAGSFEMRRLVDSQAPLATVIVRWKLKNNQFTFDRAGILISDCERGYGKLRAYDIDSGAYSDQFEYVNAGGSVGSHLGDALCGLAAQDGNTNTRRGY